jgi:ATP-dependent Clp protease, protease subunit
MRRTTLSRIVRESIDRFFDYDVHVETRTIYMGSIVSNETYESGTDAILAERMIKALTLLGTTPDKPIRILMNNLGGYWFHGMAIYDAIKACPAHVTIEVFGQAMSMGSIILQAADDRILHPNAWVMVHDGTDGFAGTPKSFEAWAVHSKKIRKKMYEIYAERSGKPASYWEKKCANDYILSAVEAVEEGLADSVSIPPTEVQADGL